MFSIIIHPRFGDADILGHINNTVLAQWFETARNPFFEIFVPDLKIEKETFSLIMAHTDYDFLHELFFQKEVDIRTWISRIGTKSFTVYHEAWQDGQLCAKGNAVVVHYDFVKRQSTPLPDEKKKLLEEHLRPLS
jgi:acyl-CoA thioester hydrolase